MEKNFDPYLQWLGIRDPERPPNHYRLLGLDLFEADKNVIAGAADRQMAHVRTFQGGKYSEESQRLLNEISAAKLCLMREGRKAKYDDELREQNGVGAAPAMPAAKPAVKAPATSAAGTTAGPIQVDAPSPSSLVVGKKSNGGFPWMWVAAGVGLLVVVGLIIGLAAKQAAQSGTPVANNGGANENIGTAENGGSSNAETENDENDPPTGNGGNDQEDGGITAQPGDGDNGDNGNGENGTGNGADGHETNSAVDEPGDGTPAPWDVARVAEKITGLEAPKVTVSKSVLEPLRIAREAMKNRDLAAVDSHLSDALAQAKSASEIGEVQRLSALNDWLSNFWDAVQSAATSLSPGDYFAFSGQEVAVVASSPNSITLRAKGGQKKTFSTDPAAIDAELAIALARHYLNGSSPQAAVGVAAFEALDRDGNHPTAVLLVQEASSQAIPVEPLETELTHDYKLLSMAGTGPASASTNGESGGPTAEPTDNRQDVPSGEPYEKARRPGGPREIRSGAEDYGQPATKAFWKQRKSKTSLVPEPSQSL